MYQYQTKGVCSRSITFDIDEAGLVRNVRFEGGCHGNTQGLCALIEGMDARDAIARLDGIDCRGRGTSCPDQLAKALRKALEG